MPLLSTHPTLPMLSILPAGASVDKSHASGQSAEAPLVAAAAQRMI
jgi:hypothetical protein